MALIVAVSIFLLTSAGVYLILERSVFRVILGISLLGHAANLVVLASGGWHPRVPVVVPGAVASRMADPLPQALILTAIVISLAMTIYLLALVSANALRSGVVEVEPPPAFDGDRSSAAILAELEGREESPSGGGR